MSAPARLRSRRLDAIGATLARVERTLDEAVARADRLAALTDDIAMSARRQEMTRRATAEALDRTEATLSRIERRIGLSN